VRVLETSPSDALDVDAEILGQEAAHPATRRLAIGAHADALAVQIGGLERAALGIIENRVMLIAPDDGRGKEDVRQPVFARLEVGDDRELAEIIAVSDGLAA